LNDKSTEAESLTASATQSPTLQEANRKKVEALQKEVEAYMKDFVKKNKETFVGKVIEANIEPELPKELPKKPNGRPDSTYLFNYYKNHFFDNIDFADERFLRSPFIQNRLERYFKDLVYQIKDSVIKEADKLLLRAKSNKEVYRYTLWWVTNKYENSEVVGLDGVFIHLAENYYLKDVDWLDSTQKAKFRERVNVLKPLQTGLVFPPIYLSDFQGVEHTALEPTTPYTIVYFYDPDCGHCKDSAPKLVDFYEKNKNRVTVLNISVEYDVKKITDFVNTYKTGSMLNLWDSKGRYNFRDSFDVYSTPTNYILDRNKRIIAKRIPVDKFEDFLNFYERQQMDK
jgi:thiol-disulfide isomerase/thioredoxin